MALIKMHLSLFLPRKVGMLYIGLSLPCVLIFLLFTKFTLERPLRAVKAQMFYDHQSSMLENKKTKMHKLNKLYRESVSKINIMCF